MALQVEVYEGELLRRLETADEGHLNGIPDRTSAVQINKMGLATVHLVDLGQRPGLLVNNTTYPITGAQRTDRDITHDVDKLETTNTIVTHDELEALPYDKENTVLDDHEFTLREGRVKHNTYGLGPDANSTSTPIIETTGAAADYNQLFKRCTVKDITLLKLKLDLLKIPQAGRVLVLSAEHANDLLQEDEAFRNQFHIIATGRPVDMYGFKLYMYIDNPFYQGDVLANYAKQAFGAVYNQGLGAAGVRHRRASLAYHPLMMWKTMTTPMMYYDEAEKNPRLRQAEVGFRMYTTARPMLPQTETPGADSTHAIAAIVPADA